MNVICNAQTFVNLWKQQMCYSNLEDNLITELLFRIINNYVIT